MKRSYLLLILHITTLLSMSLLLSTEYNPALVVVIMIKDEASVIEATLQPFVDGGVKHFFIFDTGSTDNTIEITQNFFKKHDIADGYIEEEPFIDFATSRNHALERAHQRFPNAGFMIMPDAEWYLNDAAGLLTFCIDQLNDHNPQCAHQIRILNNAVDFYTPRLIRCNCDVQFKGVVHETIICSFSQPVPENIYFQYLPESHGIEKSNQRYSRDRELLYKEYNKDPQGTRTLFYLARACEDIGNLEEAYHLYKQRIALVGWPEEDFMAMYRLAQTTEKLSYNNPNYPWHEALHYYLEAYAMRPQRAEPLISIAYYYVHRNEMEKAFLFAQQAAEIPYPYADVLFIQKYAYEYMRYELLARCAWYTQKYEVGEQAAKKAYQVHPEYPHALHNIKCYENRKITTDA